MNMAHLQNQNMLSTFLFMTSIYPLKLLVAIQPNTTQVITAQLCVGSSSQVFKIIKTFTYIRPVNCSIQIPNGINPLKMFWSCHSKISKNKYYYTTLAIILYATKPTK